MIYVDTSVVLAQLLAEDRRPSDSLWESSLVSSRLLEYEAWNRLSSIGIAARSAPITTERVMSCQRTRASAGATEVRETAQSPRSI